MQPISNDATTALLRALRDKFGKFAGLSFEEVRSRSWASATFTGARHEIALELRGQGASEEAARFCAGLETSEFRLRGHVLADIALVSSEADTTGPEPRHRIRIEALTVEDC
jgi:hypothetical protein